MTLKRVGIGCKLVWLVMSLESETKTTEGLMIRSQGFWIFKGILWNFRTLVKV